MSYTTGRARGAPMPPLSCLPSTLPKEKPAPAKKAAAQEDELRFDQIIHDFKLPLQVMLLDIRLTENLIADGASDLKAVCAPYFASMMKNCYRLLRSINHLCEDARVSQGIVRLHAAPLCPAPLLGRLCAFAEKYAACLGFDLRYDDLCPRAAVCADAEKLERMVLNLLSNAFKYTRAGGAIDVRLYRAGDWTFIEVENEGETISESLRPRLFERFCTGETDPQRGTGLGLFIVRELARLHGGDAYCADPTVKGARFVIQLPAVDAPVEDDARPDDVPDDRVRVELSDSM